MNSRRGISIFKCLVWCLLIFLLSFLCALILSFVLVHIIGWLRNHVSFIGGILSNKVIYYIFMTATSADIGRRTASIFMKLFSGKIENSRNVVKGFISAGILLAIYGVISIVMCLIWRFAFLDLSVAVIGFWYIVLGRISENEYKDNDAERYVGSNDDDNLEQESQIRIEKDSIIKNIDSSQKSNDEDSPLSSTRSEVETKNNKEEKTKNDSEMASLHD